MKVSVDSFVGMANQPDPAQVGSRWSQNIVFGPDGTWIQTRPGTEHLTRGASAVQPQADGTTYKAQVYRLKDERIEQVVVVVATCNSSDGVNGASAIFPVQFAPLTAIGLGDDGAGSGVRVLWQDNSVTPVVNPPRDAPIDFTSTGPLGSLVPFYTITIKVYVTNATDSELVWDATPVSFSGTGLTLTPPTAPADIPPGETCEIILEFTSSSAGLAYGTITFGFAAFDSTVLIYATTTGGCP